MGYFWVKEGSNGARICIVASYLARHLLCLTQQAEQHHKVFCSLLSSSGIGEITGEK